ncbi:MULTISPECIES: phosphonate C-P lyase system protein PhnL [unclassified Halomonas]|uniref:phosphonate C-P lyase system protein PhnL n=1 Tax=unclassified Halomonas TaxID=2609666 RepID=UPI002885DE22|nr:MULTISPECIES: phosphonate C-P lyase system protein PhnL [unclassified Halomonas]MDT0502599.1 phosphonate C-P lyase system protein PhnL [Halomonas sp. PAR7]MDT0513634.1 phosphonate C-P lyase system protein PhnL [Halomonas sp. LES1]MDT0592979.1 phosphonate C-P lyase system protein PhnL [Halomonas sp. PAR8]
MTSLTQPFLSVDALHKAFVLHGQEGMTLEVMRDLHLTLSPGECLVLSGPSGIGKSTLLKMLHGSYRVTGGALRLHFEDGELSLGDLPAHAWHTLRRDVIGYVSQFLRVIPRVPAVEVVMEPLLARGVDTADARVRAETLLARLNLPERLWRLPPGTFSGGEQQRVNIARGFIAEHPLLLLDEPTASLDAANREVVIELIQEAKARGAALLGIFHDEEVRDRVADRLLPLTLHMGAALEAAPTAGKEGVS